ncbi:sensor histidine kinase [Metabacillus bambusae]|uniref:histidine kinase n=1 Tax=Metabacillus bambusae TaxID=2795218 RepID=A0ABS3N0T8_9BACI|nr:sensor histidine kinase [Metabacillus bambusae]MBO1511844.1 histidine kinase [Metabacillus bambusae]
MKFFRRLIIRYFHHKTLRYQLQVTYLLIVIIPFIAIGYVFYEVSVSAMKKDALENYNSLMEAVSKNINAFLEGTSKEISIYASIILDTNSFNLNLLRGEQYQSERWLVDNKHLYETFNRNDFISIRSFDNLGNLVGFSTNTTNNKVYEYNSHQEETWQQRIKHNYEDELLFDIHPLEINGVYSFTASRAIIDPVENVKIGYVSFDKELNSFTNNFKEIENRFGGELQIIKENGTLLYHSNNTLIGKLADKKLLAHLDRLSADTFIEENSNGEKIIMSYNKLTNESFTIVGSMPLEVLIKDINSLGRLIFYSVLILVVLILILSYLLSIYLTNPLKVLMKQMSSVEKGNFNPAIDIPQTNIETTQLGNRFQTMVRTIDNLVTIQYQTELHKKDAELKALIMQINPHFFYNTLEVISGIADEEEVYKISDITESLSRLLRYNLSHDRELVTLKEELAHCNHYFFILKSRFEDELSIEMKADPEIEQFLIMKMILQPLIENSVKHGVEMKIGQGKISLIVKKLKDRIYIEVADNGVGFDEDKLNDFKKFTMNSDNRFSLTTSSNHLGLKNVYTRLSLLYGDNLSFEIDSVKNKGTVIKIEFPATTIDIRSM